MLGLLDSATQLTDLRRETPCPEPLTCGPALKTTALAITFLIILAVTFRLILPRMLFERVLPAPA